MKQQIEMFCCLFILILQNKLLKIHLGLHAGLLKEGIMKTMFCLLQVLFFTTIFLSCQSNAPKTTESDKPNTQLDSTSFSITAQTLYDSLKNPWGMAWLPDGRLLITERAGQILIFKNDKFTGEKLSGVPKVFNQGQGGLLDIKLHPDYAKNGWIYITYSKPVSGGAATAVMRFKLQGNQMVDKQDIF